MIEFVISGGQTGADQAGWRAAKAAGIPTGGWMPLGFKTEDGRHPEFNLLYGAQQHESPEYPPRTRANVSLADATVIFDTTHGDRLEDLSRGSQFTLKTTMRLERPSLVVAVDLGESPTTIRAKSVVKWLNIHEVSTLNIAGNRESKAPGIGAWVEAYLTEVFRILRNGELFSP